MLVHISALIRDFYYKLCHFPVFLPLFWMAKPKAQSTIRSHYSKRQTAPSNLMDVPQVTSSQDTISVVQTTLHDFSSSRSLKVKASVRDHYIFLLVDKPVLGRRAVHPLNH